MFYDKTMKHFEAHTIENSEDVRIANEIGLDVFDDETCEKCLRGVGETDMEKFIPFVVLLDDESEWIVCMECASPVL